METGAIAGAGSGLASVDTLLGFAGEHWVIKITDVREGLAKLPDNSVHVVVTSIPYWLQRDYGFPGQIGLEATWQEYVEVIVRVFREVRRVLRPDGLLFLNVGDKRVDATMIGLPWRIAFALQADGWNFCQDVVWHRPTAMPESVFGHRWMRCRKRIKQHSPDDPKWEQCPGCKKCEPNGGFVLRRGKWRPSCGHEYVFQFSKSKAYFADGDSSKEPVSGGAHSRGHGINPKSAAVDVSNGRELKSKANNHFAANCGELVEKRNIRSVWSIVPEGFKGGHFATFPLKLVKRCLSAATSRGGCCAKCGAQFPPIVSSDRKPTRPGNNTKVGRAEARPDSPYNDTRGSIVGNRDPKRHTTTVIVEGYRAACDCNAGVGRPIVLDCFAGVSRAGRVAINMGCEFIGLEGSAEYAALGAEEIERPWNPNEEKRKKGHRKKRKPSTRQKLLNFE